jgi:iron(II)-dependent oxidoreductase
MHTGMDGLITRQAIVEMLIEARGRTLDLVADLKDEELMGPRLRIVNPLLWEIGHVAWFQEKWALRHLRTCVSCMEGADGLYDSAAVAHDTRWDLPLPTRNQTLQYMERVLDRVTESLGPDPLTHDEVYFHLLPLFHEDMHAEAIAYTRQTLGYPAPRFRRMNLESDVPTWAGPCPGDVEISGGDFTLGASPEYPFVFDNEKWAHPVLLRPFRIARAPVSNFEFKAFVEAGGYEDERWWSREGWDWRLHAGARHPVYWQRESAGCWLRREFDRMVALEDHKPVLHVNWFEADAYCRWAGRRLPSEAEWEIAASQPRQSGARRMFPWGNEAPTPWRANLDWSTIGCVEVGSLPAGDSAHGCRQMIGNVWEWTASHFLPYPGFVADPYAEYSAPWFGDHMVLRGGCWATRSRLIRNTWRNFYTPDRRDVWAGFRTCAA